ncbi:hypothetical protein L7F22_001017 [Adiantum nelumboides]|nr:hypothetical protein [Adiantum nelumboides]
MSSIIGNVTKCGTDLRDGLPVGVNFEILKEWDFQWRAQKAKTKHARDMDTQFFFSKKIRAAQAHRAISVEDKEITMQNAPVNYLDSTLINSSYTISIGVEHDAILQLATLGRGAYGECQKVQMKGISFFPRGTFYVAKKYLGPPEIRLKSFEKELSVDLMHNGIVQSIGHAREVPWISIFPYFNGGSISDMLLSLPFEKGSYVRVIRKLQGGGRGINRGSDPILSEAEMCHILAFCNNAPSLIHAMVQTMAFAHCKGVLHCDLHPRNVVLDFTQDHQPRIGMIDWGLALRVGYEKRVSQAPHRKDHDFRPWLALELLGADDEDVYKKHVDVYALSWMILQICTFCEEFSSLHETSWDDTDAASQIQHISFIMRANYFCFSERKSLVDLDKKLHRMRLDPSKCLRPLTEMMSAFF